MPFVVIRLRYPLPSTHPSLEPPCIHLSSSLPNTLTVHNSKTHQDFTFDLITTESTPQSSIFTSLLPSFMETIKKGLTSSEKRMDHLVMGYGQSGSGKSYMMFGEKGQEGVMPRLVDRLKEEGYEVGLRAFEIYNEGVFDLLGRYGGGKGGKGRGGEKQIEIKEDLERGVHVVGLEMIEVPKHIPSIHVITDILSYTYACEPSSPPRKSHKILTLFIRHPSYHPYKQLKLHFVQLASCDGQREYFTRRPSISINKSLNNLNLILSNLMEINSTNNNSNNNINIPYNTKPKKYIPFRESKLTFYLKDMLSASGSNKWILTSLFVERSRLSESINSLMFAKRAKCLMEGGGGGGEGWKEGMMDGEKTTRRNVRQEVRMIREELQNSRFIHAKSIDTEWEYADEEGGEKQKQQIQTRSPLKMINMIPTPKPFHRDPNPTNKPPTFQPSHHLPTLLQNQTHFRQLLSLYQDRITALQTKSNKKQIIKGIYNEKRLLENLNHKYAKLVLNFPNFAGIISENKALREELREVKWQSEGRNSKVLGAQGSQRGRKWEIEAQGMKKQIAMQQKMMDEYERVIENLRDDIKRCTQQLKTTFQSDTRSKQLPQPLSKILNENDCLKLTILTHEQQIQRLHQQYSFISLEIRAISQQNRYLTSKNRELDEILSQGATQQHGLNTLITKLLEIKSSAEREAEEMSQLLHINKELESKIEQNYSSLKPCSTKTPSTEPKPLTKEPPLVDSLKSQSRTLRKLLKQSQDKKLLLQKQLSKLSSRVAELTRELTLTKQAELSMFQELTNTSEKMKLLQTKEKVQGEKQKQLTLQIARLKREVQCQEKVKWGRENGEIGELQGEGERISNKRLSLARKGRSELEGLLGVRSTKGFESNKSLNNTMIVCCEKLATIVEPGRVSSGKKLIVKEAKGFGKEKEKDVKPFLFKSKEIKNSIVQKV